MGKKLAALSILIVILAIYYYKKPQIRLGKLIETNAGLIQGSLGKSRDGRDFYQWLKIPFAQPPINSLRFASPKPIEKWEGIADGTIHGPECAQITPFGSYEGEEDCLHLNIHVPKLDQMEQNSLLPVVVFIHGGAFVLGSSKGYGADYFMDENVVLITVNYRLHLFGFLTTGDDQIRGNMALKDLVLSLKWIQENIKKFHGDPSKVTIMGESAGACMAQFLLLSQKSQGLFHKVVTMSGVATAPWAFKSAKMAAETTRDYAQKLGCPTDDSTQMTKCLRQLNTRDLITVFKQDLDTLYVFDPTLSGQFLTPVIEALDDDEAFLAQNPYEILTQGRQQRLPWLLGGTADEGLLMSLAFERDRDDLKKMADNWTVNIQRFLTLSIFPEEVKNEIAAKVRDFYFKSAMTQDEEIQNYTRLFSDSFFHSYINQAATIQRQFSPVYLYHFVNPKGPSFGPIFVGLGRKRSPLIEISLFILKSLYNKVLGIPAKNYGTSHGDDLLMLFPFMQSVTKETETYELSKNFVKLVVQFAVDEKSMEFKNIPFRQTPKEGKLNYLMVAEEPRIIENLMESSMTFWRSLDLLKLYSNLIATK